MSGGMVEEGHTLQVLCVCAQHHCFEEASGYRVPVRIDSQPHGGRTAESAVFEMSTPTLLLRDERRPRPARHNTQRRQTLPVRRRGFAVRVGVTPTSDY
jgi:hypothetical protein